MTEKDTKYSAPTPIYFVPNPEEYMNIMSSSYNFSDKAVNLDNQQYYILYSKYEYVFKVTTSMNADWKYITEGETIDFIKKIKFNDYINNFFSWFKDIK